MDDRVQNDLVVGVPVADEKVGLVMLPMIRRRKLQIPERLFSWKMRMRTTRMI